MRTRRMTSRSNAVTAMCLPYTPYFRVVRTSYIFNWTFGTAATADFWRYFQGVLNDLPDVSQYQQVFDEYRIGGIKYTFRPRYDNSENGNVLPLGYAHIIRDPTSTITPTGLYTQSNVNTFLQNGAVKSYTLNKPFSIYYKPKIYDVVGTSGSSSQRIINAPFLRLDTDTGVQHRGFHIFLQNNNMTAANSSLQLDVYVTFYLTFRGSR